MRVTKSDGATKFTFTLCRELPVPHVQFSADFPLENSGDGSIAVAAMSSSTPYANKSMTDIDYHKTPSTIRFSCYCLREIANHFVSMKQVAHCASPMVTDKVFPYPPNLVHLVSAGILWTVPRQEVANATAKLDKVREVSITFDHVGSNITGISCDTVMYPLASAILGAVLAFDSAAIAVAEIRSTYPELKPSSVLDVIRGENHLYTILSTWEFDYIMAQRVAKSCIHETGFAGKVVFGKAYGKHSTKLRVQIADWRYLPYHIPEIPAHLVPARQLQEFNQRFKDANYRYYPLPAVLGLALDNVTEFFI